MPSPFEPWRDRQAAIDRLLEARRAGATLCQAAAAAGVHVATVCRWQARDPILRKALYDANQQGCNQLSALLPRRQPPSCVPCHPLCPTCAAPVVVRRAFGFLRFWGCNRWPLCPWASWRPRQHLPQPRPARLNPYLAVQVVELAQQPPPKDETGRRFLILDEPQQAIYGFGERRHASYPLCGPAGRAGGRG
jgi:hypothetical protein